MTLRVIIGPPCSGKSTYVDENADADQVRVDFDRLALTLGSARAHGSQGSVRKSALAARRAAIDELLKHEESDGWIIHTRPSDKRLEQYSAVGAEFILIDPGEDVCLARAEEDDRPSGTAEAIKDWYASPPAIPEKDKKRMTLIKAGGGAVAVKRAEFGLDEIKFAEGDDADAKMTFKGYGAVFNNTDSYGDVIEPGAFKKTLADSRKSKSWPAMLLQHGGIGFSAEDLTPIGIWTELEEDEKGLLITGKLAETQRGLEAYGLLKMTPRPALNGLSIGYRARKFTMGTKPDEPRRRLHEVELIEVSLVTFPANPKARIGSVKSGDGLGIRDAEKALREAGFSSNEAKAILAKGFGAIGHREGDDCDPAILQDATARALKALSRT